MTEYRPPEKTSDEIQEEERLARLGTLKRGNPLSQENLAAAEKDNGEYIPIWKWTETLQEALALDGPIVLAQVFARYGTRGWDHAIEHGGVAPEVLAKAYSADGRESSLICAVETGSTPWVLRCLKFGANPRWKNHVGQSAAHLIGEDLAWRTIMMDTKGRSIGSANRLYPTHFKRWERFLSTAWNKLLLPSLTCDNGTPQLDWLNRSALDHVVNQKHDSDPRKTAVIERLILATTPTPMCTTRSAEKKRHRLV